MEIKGRLLLSNRVDKSAAISQANIYSSYVKYSLYPNVLSGVSRVLDVDNWLEVKREKSARFL